MSNTEIQPAGTYYSDKFEYINQKLREHFQLADKEIDKVKQHVNELVVIVHNDNKDWSLKKICEYIAGRNDDLEEYGFSAKTIYNYLNEQNRQLVDSRKYKRKKGDSTGRTRRGKGTKSQNNVTEPFHESVHETVPEESSRTKSDNLTEIIDTLNKQVADFPSSSSSLSSSSDDNEVIYNDPGKIINEQQEQIKELLRENEELKQPYDVEWTLEGKDHDMYIIIHATPENKGGWAEWDEVKIKKMGLNKRK